VDGFPEILALAPPEAVAGQDVSGEMDRGAGLRRQLPGAVGGAGIDHDDFVEERVAVHQLAFEHGDDPAHGLLLVQGGNAQADRQPFAPLFGGESTGIREVFMPKGVRRQPGIDALADLVGSRR